MTYQLGVDLHARLAAIVPGALPSAATGGTMSTARPARPSHTHASSLARYRGAPCHELDAMSSMLCLCATCDGVVSGSLPHNCPGSTRGRRAEFGSFHRGFAMAPATGVPVLDLHGSKDTTVPANVSLSADGYYYTTTEEIFNGGVWPALKRVESRAGQRPGRRVLSPAPVPRLRASSRHLLPSLPPPTCFFCAPTLMHAATHQARAACVLRTAQGAD